MSAHVTYALTRRAMLKRCASGFGSVALASLLNDRAFAGAGHGTHFPARAKSVIFLYMDGGPSQVDTFDPKPMLAKHNGKEPADFFDVAPTQFNNNGTILASPWKFERHGESGLPVSELFPHVATVADELAVVRSMVSEFPEHTSANYFLHAGSGLQGRPSMGAWLNYGLGSESQELPGFVVLNGGLIPPGGIDCFGSGFLPASFQASIFQPSGSAVANIAGPEPAEIQARKLELIHELDSLAPAGLGEDDAVESAISNYELAYRMQAAVPDLMDVASEPDHIRELYGLDSPNKATHVYAMECLVARRLVERGVRFVELTCPAVKSDRWDQHSELKEGHELNAAAVDQPIAGLLTDLRQRGMLDETLVVWAGEFGRTPFAQGRDGRDHNPEGYTIWLAGGGIRPGTVYGATDEFGYKAIENRVEVHDLHATMLHLLGVDHRQSTYRFGGRDMRLTDVKGHVLHELIA